MSLADKLYALNDQLIKIEKPNDPNGIKLYKELIECSRQGSQEKKLAAQLLGKYFGSYAALHEDATEAIVDLCEEDDLVIRATAIRQIPLLTKASPTNLSRMADILIQLLSTEEELESTTVKDALDSLAHQNIKEVFSALFHQILHGSGSVRRYSLNWIQANVPRLGSALIYPHSDVEQHLSSLIKQVLEDVTDDEFTVLIGVLVKLHIYQGEGRVKLVQLLEELSEANKSPSVSDVDATAKFVHCFTAAAPLCKNGVCSIVFWQHVTNELLPKLAQLTPELKLFLLRAVAESSPSVSSSIARAVFPSLHTVLLDTVPRPSVIHAPQFNFSYIECVLYVTHQIGSKAPWSFKNLTGVNVNTPSIGQPWEHLDPADKLTDRRTDFKIRLDYLLQTTKANVAQLTTRLSELKRVDASKLSANDQTALREQIEQVTIALATTKNIHVMTEPWLQQKPTFFSGAINLSWVLATPGTKQPLQKKPKQPGAKIQPPGAKNKQQNNNGQVKKRRLLNRDKLHNNKNGNTHSTSNSNNNISTNKTKRSFTGANNTKKQVDNKPNKTNKPNKPFKSDKGNKSTKTENKFGKPKRKEFKGDKRKAFAKK